MKTKTAAVSAIALLAAAGVASYSIGDRAELLTRTIALPRKLSISIPLELGGWRGTNDPMDAKTVETLQVDDYVRRRYVHRDGADALLYVAYHGNKERGMQTYYHNPTVCFRSQGWTIENQKTSTETLSDAAKEIPVCRYVFGKEGERLSVMTFFKVDREFLDQSPRNKPLWSLLDRATPQFSDSPGTFVQVQIVVPVGKGGEFEAADLQSRFLRDFGRAILDAVEPGPSR